MKKYFSRMFTLVLVAMLFATVALPASAAGIHENQYAVPTINARAQSSGLPFTFETDTNVSGLWTTNRDVGGYNFVPGRVNGSTINVTGSFQHSSYSGKGKAGVCYYQGGTAYPVISSTKTVGSDFNGSASKSILNKDGTYYGFVKNASDGGYVYDAIVTISAS